MASHGTVGSKVVGRLFSVACVIVGAVDASRGCAAEDPSLGSPSLEDSQLFVIP